MISLLLMEKLIVKDVMDLKIGRKHCLIIIHQGLNLKELTSQYPVKSVIRKMQAGSLYNIKTTKYYVQTAINSYCIIAII